MVTEGLPWQLNRSNRHECLARYETDVPEGSDMVTEGLPWQLNRSNRNG